MTVSSIQNLVINLSGDDRKTCREAANHQINNQLIIKDLGLTDYLTTLTAMQKFTQNRTGQTSDELWFTQHTSVYTIGLNRKDTRLPDNNISVIQSDRGGKITYHGEGQVIIYLLIDLKRSNLAIRQLVKLMESSIIELLTTHNIIGNVKKDAPGVFVKVDGVVKKIASLGLRIKNQCCYHGLSLNVNMDLKPFNAIDPCGYAGLMMTQTSDLGAQESPQKMGESLLKLLEKKLQ